MDLKQLKIKFDNLRSEYTSLKNFCEGQVTRWEWATNPIYTLEPYDFERHGWGPGRRLKAEPSDKNGKIQYGFDSQNRVVLEREYVEFEGQFYETFIIYKNDYIESAHFSYYKEKDPINVEFYQLQNGNIISLMGYAEFGWSREDYKYRQNRIVRIKQWHQEFGRKPFSSTSNLSYDDVGVLQMITATSSEDRAVCLVYQRPPKGINLNTLIDLVQQKLVQAIPELVAKRRLTQEVYCLALAYDLESDSFLPPLIGIGLASELQQWQTNHGTHAKDFMWNPAEFSNFNDPKLVLRDRELINVCNLINQEISRKNSFALVGKILNEVAIKLMKLDWGETLKINKDFVVYAVDLECCELKRNLKACLPFEKLASLKDNGWI